MTQDRKIKVLKKKSLKKVCQVVSFNLSKSTAEVPLLYE